ncbi:MAG: Ig-like domain-containing protein [Verrucomicrobiota bacterium]
MSVLRGVSQGTKHRISDLLSNDSDGDGEPVEFHALSTQSQEGGSLTTSGGWIFYTPPAGFVNADAFTYAVRDQWGATAVATVEIEPRVGYEPAANLNLVDLGGGTYRIVFSGIPWRTYNIEYTESTTQPNWQFITMRMTDSQGRFEYDDTLPAETPSRYYRSVSLSGGNTASPFRTATWTNFIAHTNGRTMEMWSERSHPEGWPQTTPTLAWNTNSILYGLTGFTGISQCNEFEGAPGQIPVTLLTRRHGYARGHSMGTNGLRSLLAGKRVWFCAADNTVVSATVAAEWVRVGFDGVTSHDYTIVVFSEDVPANISPVAVISAAALETYYAYTPDLPYVFLAPEQTGRCAAGVLPFIYPIMKGGDSGSPNLILSPDNKLIMFSGRGTSRIDPQMQVDMDALSGFVGLNPSNYQLQWYDLSPWAP